MLAHIILKNAVSVTLDNGDNKVVDASHPNFNKIIAAIKAGRYSAVDGLIDIPKHISTASKGLVKVVNGSITYNGLPVHSYLAKRILELLNQGFEVSPWINFMEKLYSNPDPYSITQLYEFLERAQLPITPDGDFLAYKKVRDNYKDVHSGTFDNSVGQKPWMDRALCDNNPSNTCSRGLHFCSKGYLRSFGGERTVIVKVNPRDVVSIPADHNAEKARAATYEVVGELDQDYSHEDMEKSAVLPSPRDKASHTAFAKVAPKTTAKGPSDLQKRVMRSRGIYVRDIAKNLGVTQTVVLASAGKYYTFDDQGGSDGRFGYWEITFTPKGTKWVQKN